MHKKTTTILMIVMLVNALSYGTMIPLLYPYASKFGMGPMGLSLLFAAFSFFQFLATPIIGRMSDLYGRKPLLLICLFGTALSQLLFAAAGNTVVLFLARILDGITGGNMSVAQAIISDTHTPQERTKAYGLLGATFGFGFVFGPALGGILSTQFLALPFLVSAALATIGTVLGILFLPETLVPSLKQKVSKEPFLDLRKMVVSLRSGYVGILLLVTLCSSIAQNAFIIGFNTITNDVFRLSTAGIGVLFTMFGLASVIMQAFGIRLLTKRFSDHQLLLTSLLLGVVFTFMLSLSHQLIMFVVFLMMYMWIPPAFPFLTALLSKHTNNEDQGEIMGLSQSYVSIGQIIGPLAAGAAASYSVFAAFWVAVLFWGVSVILLRNAPKNSTPVDL